MNYDVFISYSRKDTAVAKQICAVFDAYKRYYKFEYFFDTSEIGIKSEYLKRIASAISQSKSMLFLASNDSYASTFCAKELLFAEDGKIDIYRYALDKSQPPQDIKLLLITQHYLEAALCPIEEMVRQVLSETLKQDIKPLSELQMSEYVVPNPTPSAKDKLKGWINVVVYLSLAFVVLFYAIRTCTDSSNEVFTPETLESEVSVVKDTLKKESVPQTAVKKVSATEKSKNETTTKTTKENTSTKTKTNSLAITNNRTQTITAAEEKSAVVNASSTKQLTSELKGVTPIQIDTTLTAKQLYIKGLEHYRQKDYNSAVQYYYESAKRGHASAQCDLGYCYRKGIVIARNDTEGVNWYRKAAEQGNARAQFNLGVCYAEGQGVTQDYYEAVKWYRKAAEQGNAKAQCNLGYSYAKGLGVTQDDYETVKWYRKAAEQGDASAQCYLGYCYEKGLGVTQDDYEAAKWYRKAAEQGNADAQCNLGGCYYKGLGVTKDEYEAVKWYRKAAEKGIAQAQYNLGLCYELGKCVTKDEYEAVKWYRKAAEQGYENAKKRLQELGY